MNCDIVSRWALLSQKQPILLTKHRPQGVGVQGAYTADIPTRDAITQRQPLGGIATGHTKKHVASEGVKRFKVKVCSLTLSPRDALFYMCNISSHHFIPECGGILLLNKHSSGLLDPRRLAAPIHPPLMGIMWHLH
jgi:hypothetical protein